MTIFAIFTLLFFIVWMLIFLHKTFITYISGEFDNPAVRTLWPMTLGVGIGIFVYSYELEYIAQQYLGFLPFSMSSIRAVCALLFVVLSYYHAVDKYTDFDIKQWMPPFLIVSTILIVLADGFFHEMFPYEQFQVWMTLLIIPPTLLASIMIAPTTRIILRHEVKPLNRAHYHWWVLELIASSLSAFVFLGDAIYKVWTQSYEVYTPAVVVAQLAYLVLAMAAQARIVLPPQHAHTILYFERFVIYLRLRFIRFMLGRKVDNPRAYAYDRLWLPTYDRLELEIRRSFITIMDNARLWKEIDPTVSEQFDKIRQSREPEHQVIQQVLQVKLS